MFPLGLSSVQKRRITCSNELHHFDTTTFTLRFVGHISIVYCVVERIMASGIFPRVAFEAFDGAGT